MDRLYRRFARLIDAWQSRDTEQVLSFMHEDIVWHYAAAAMPPVRGKAQAAKLLARFQADMHQITWRIFAHAETENRLFVEGVDDYRTSGGTRVAAPYAGVLEFQDDLVIGWRDYVDVGVIAAQKAGEPLSAQVSGLIERTAS